MVDAVLLYFSAAFEVIDHDRLLIKLAACINSKIGCMGLMYFIDGCNVNTVTLLLTV